MVMDLIKPDKNYNYLLILRKPNKEPICILPYTSFSYTNKFNDYNEISFTLNKFLYNQRTKENYTLPAWDKIKAGQVVEVQTRDGFGLDSVIVNQENFIIQQPSYNESDLGGQDQSYSCIAEHQQTFNKLRIRGYKDTRQLYNCTVTEDGVPTEILYTEYKDGHSYFTSFVPDKMLRGGILNYVVESILNNGIERSKIDGSYPAKADIWKVVYYDPNLKKVSTTQTISEEDAAELITDVCDIWQDNMVPCIRNIYNAAMNLREFVSTTKEDSLLLEAYTNQWYMSIDRYTALLQEGGTIGDSTVKYQSLDDIVKEPLLGAFLLSDLEQILVELQVYLQDISGFNFVSDGADYVDILQENIRTLTSYFLNSSGLENGGILSMLAEVYKNAPGSVPFRTLDLNCNLTEVFQKLADSYSCVFKFDNYKKEIYVYARDNEAINATTPLVLSNQNYITNVSFQEQNDQVITRLYAKGKDGLEVGGYSVPGVNYVDNFDYFFNSRNVDTYLTKIDDTYPLAEALDKYQKILKDVQKYQDIYDGIYDGEDKDNPQYYYPTYATDENYLISMWEWSSDNKSKIEKKYTIRTLQKHLAELSNILAVTRPLAKSFLQIQYSIEYPKNDVSFADGYTEISTYAQEAANTELNRIKDDFKTYVDWTLGNTTAQYIYNISTDSYTEGTDADVQPRMNNTYFIADNIALCESALIAWQRKFQYNNILDPATNIRLFSDSLLLQMRDFLRVEEVDFSDITDGRTLYKYAQQYLEYMNKIPLTIDLDLVSLFDVLGAQLDWLNMANVGSFLYIDVPAFDINYEKLRMISYTHSISDGGNSLSASFSNTFELQNAYNTVLNDIWAYSYKQIKDINTYRDSWQDFINKQNSLLVQGIQIRSDVNGIVSKKGSPVITSAGLKVSPAKHNMLQSTGSGYYVKRPLVTNGQQTIPITNKKSGTDIDNVDPKNIDPEIVEFDGGNLVYDENNNKIVVKGMGGGAGLPWTYGVPIVSERIKALRYGDTSQHVAGVGDRAGHTYVYYQTIKDTSYTWYEQEIDVNATAVPAVDEDENGNALYWSSDNLTLSYTGTEDKRVMLYATIGQPKIVFQAYRNTTAGAEHLPIFKFGIGDGNGHGYGYLEKVKDGMKVYYYTTTGTETPDIMNRNRGIYIKNDGVYQIRGENECYIPFIHYQSTLVDSAEIEEGDWVLVPQS